MGDEIEQIKDRLDVVEIVGEYVTLKKAGAHFKGLCPFHQEKTPSFIVSPQKNIWHCFGCSEGGDVFSFIQKIENVDFVAALKLLAERAGVELKQRSPESSDRRQRLIELLDITARFYHEILLNQSAGKKAQDYLMKRGVEKKTMDFWQLGYAPQRWDTLQEFLRAKNYSPQEMLAAGMVGESKNGKLYDRFRGRIIFPISNVQGRVVAFGGRIVPWHETGEEGKYVNSPETELYEKRRVVYGLDKAKGSLRHATPCLVVEGYMDVVMLVQLGITNVVASSGTAFTDEAVQQLKRFTTTLHFAFDADAAGFKAGLSATEAALTAGMRVATVVLPKGKDPADMALDKPDKLKQRISQPKSLVEVLLERMKSGAKSVDQEENLQQLLPLVARVSNPVFQGEMVQELANVLHVPEIQIINQLQTTLVEKPVVIRARDDKIDDLEEQQQVSMAPEMQWLGLIIAYPSIREKMMREVDRGFILADEARKLYNELHRLDKEKSADFAQMPADELLSCLSEGKVSLAEGLRRLSEERVEQSHVSVMDEGKGLLRVMQKRYIEANLERLQQKIGQTNEVERKRALREFKKLTEELAKVEV